MDVFMVEKYLADTCGNRWKDENTPGYYVYAERISDVEAAFPQCTGLGGWLVTPVAIMPLDEAIRDAKEGRLQGGTMRFGLKNSGVDLAMDEHNAALMTPAMKQKLEELKSQIISGALRVPDYYAKKR